MEVLVFVFLTVPSTRSMCVLGVCACVQEQDVLKNLVVPCEVDPLPVREVEIDEFDVKYTANEGGGHIQNDTITLNYRLSGMQKPYAFLRRPARLSVQTIGLCDIVDTRLSLICDR